MNTERKNLFLIVVMPLIMVLPEIIAFIIIDSTCQIACLTSN